MERILIADDEKDLAFSIEVALNVAGFQTTVCHDGLAALEKVADSWSMGLPYTLVITDVQMPGLSGRELLMEMRRRGINIPVMVITGFGDKEMMIDLMRSGCDDFLEKPVEMNGLLMNIRRILDRRHIRTEVDKPASAAMRDADIYKRDYEFLRGQMDGAATAYSQMVKFDPEGLKVKLAYRYSPFGGLGGDYFDARNITGGVDVLVVDAAGRDMGSSYHSVFIRALFDRYAGQPGGGTALMEAINEKLAEPGDFCRMATALHVRLDLNSMTGALVTAGHGGMIHVAHGAVGASVLSSDGPALGARKEAKFSTHEFSFGSRDRLFIHTGGLLNASRVDGRTGARSRLAEAGLLRFIECHRALSLEGMVGQVWNDVTGFCRRRFPDDALLLAAEIPVEAENAYN
jgi:DNA-binding response OmpR family regulator